MNPIKALLRLFRLQTGSRQSTPTRQEGLHSELAFWDGWLQRRELNGFALRTDPNRVVQPWLWCHLDAASPIHRLLDVGSGPLSVVGQVAPAGRLQLTCCDVLASEYLDLLAKHGIKPLHTIDRVGGEALVRHYGPACFDLAFSNNAIDHTESPAEVLRQMALVVRPGGTVLIQVGEHEGRHGGYQGLHQWDLWEERQHLWLSAPDHEPMDVSNALDPLLERRSIERVLINPVGKPWDRPRLRVVWRRRDDR
jgi:SAM-dependent methyltransferase